MHLVIISFLAGLVTIATPCVLPLIPVIMAGSVGGRLRPIAIVVGMSITFTMMGIVTSRVGGAAGVYTDYLRTFAVLVIILMGFLLVSKRLNEKFVAGASVVIDKIRPARAGSDPGVMGGFILGLSLGIVWIPCVGPILASVLAMVAVEGNILTGSLSLFSYSLGIGLPMLIIAYTGKLTSERIKTLAKYGEDIRRAAGVVLILVGISMLLGLDRQVQSLLLPYFPEVPY
jgi:cytochrome c-type biogenesis protein